MNQESDFAETALPVQHEMAAQAASLRQQRLGQILVALMLQTSFLTPPVGFSLFYLKGVVPKGVTIRDIYIGIIPFVLLQLTMVGLCLLFPQLILWMPQQMYGSGG